MFYTNGNVYEVCSSQKLDEKYGCNQRKPNFDASHPRISKEDLFMCVNLDAPFLSHVTSKILFLFDR